MRVRWYPSFENERSMSERFTRKYLSTTTTFSLLLFVIGLLSGTALTAQSLRLENMTKVNWRQTRSFPGDDVLVFHRSNNPKNTNGQSLRYRDRNTLRLHNDSGSPLIISRLRLSNSKDFALVGGSIPSGGLVVAARSSVDVEIRFVKSTGVGRRVNTDYLTISSNATNGKERRVTLSNAYMTSVEGGAEITAQQVFEALGFRTRLGLDNNGNAVTRPASVYPTDADVNSGKEGDLILSKYFVQADPTKPVVLFQVAAFHGPGGASSELRYQNNQKVPNMSFNHGTLSHQTILPHYDNNRDIVASAIADRIEGPFYVQIAGYNTKGFTSQGPDKELLLPIRTYRAIDQNGKTIPNEYLVNMDYVGNTGCGVGSANCDWNDNTLYLINARPVAAPSSGKIADFVASARQTSTYGIGGSFELGFAGNKLNFSARPAAGGSLPSWIKLDGDSGNFTFTPGSGQSGSSVELIVSGRDYNGMTVQSSFTVIVDDAAANCTVDANRSNALKFLDCGSGQVRLEGASSNGTYRWSGPGGFSSTASAPVVSEAGTYVLTTGTGCGATDVVVVYKDKNCDRGKSNRSPVAVASADPNRGNAPLDVRLDGSKSSDPDGKIAAYRWSWPGGSASGRVVRTVLKQGTYTVTLTVTDDQGASSSATTKVEVLPEPPPRIRSFWLEAECADYGSAWKKESSSSASGGSYLAPVEDSRSGAPQDIARNRVRFTIDQVEAGSYNIFARLEGLGPFADSYYVRINGGGWYSWDTGLGSLNGFEWNLFRNKSQPLREGTNTIDFAFREAGTRLDKLHIDKQNSVPTGSGESATNCSGVAPTPIPNRAPVARATTSVTSGTAPLRTVLDGTTSSDSDGRIVDYQWAWSGGGLNGSKSTVTFPTGNYRVTLTVTDDKGAKATDIVNVVASAPLPPPTDPTDVEGFWLEAECAEVGSNWSIEEDNAASGSGYAVYTKGDATARPPGDVAANYVRFNETLAQGGNYWLFARIGSANQFDDSYWVRVNGGPWFEWSSGLERDSDYRWNRYPENPLPLVKGANTIDFAYRENGTRLDKLFLSLNDRLPSGTGNADPRCELLKDVTATTLEAECAELGAGWNAVPNSKAANGSYVTFGGKRNMNPPTINNPIDQLVFTATVGSRGDYRIFMRLRTPSISSNSVWVKVDDGDWIRFWQDSNGSQLVATEFDWRTVNDNGVTSVFALSAGTHLIRVANREPGLQIDKVSVSTSFQRPTGDGPAAANCRESTRLVRGMMAKPTTTTSTADRAFVYPNPARDWITVDVEGAYRGTVTALVIDVTGRRLREAQFGKDGERAAHKFDVGDLPAGMYRVLLFSGRERQTVSFVKH